MALGGCEIVCKYFLLLFNIIFLVGGLVFYGLGLYLCVRYSQHGISFMVEFKSSAFLIVVIGLIVLGLLMLSAGVIGDYGASYRSYSALEVFFTVVTILFLLEFILGLLSFIARERIGNFMGEFYTSLYMLYILKQDPVISIMLRFTQQKLHCCGITGIRVVEVVQATCPRPKGIMEHILMPSCPEVILNMVNSSTSLAIFAGVGALLLFAAMMCSGFIVDQIKKEIKSKRYNSAVH